MIKSRANLHEIIDLNLPGAEVGSASGVFALEILTWGISKLYMIDVWEETPSIRGMAGEPQAEHDRRYQQAVERVKGYPAVIMKGLSENVAKQIPDDSLGFVYIDACHYYDQVLNDLNVWVPKLKYGGVCALHDYKDPGYDVQRAVSKFASGKYKIHELIEDGRIENIGAYFINK